MRGMMISWVIGLSMVGGAVTTVPVVAHDASGPITNNQIDILYGFEPLSLTPEVDKALQGTLDAITSLTGDTPGTIQGTLGVIALLTSGSNGQADANSAAIQGQNSSIFFSNGEENAVSRFLSTDTKNGFTNTIRAPTGN